MALELKKPGSLIRKSLEGLKDCDDVMAVFRQPNRDEGEEILKAALEVESHPDKLIRRARNVLGLCLHSLEGVEVDGESIKIETNGSGQLRNETMDVLVPLIPKLFGLATSLCTIERDEAKNY